MRPRPLTGLWAATLLATATAVALLAPPPPAPIAGHAGTASPTSTVPDLTGDWTGGWEDTTFNVSGDMSLSIVQDGNDFIGSGTIDLTNIGVPGVGVQSGQAVGTLGGNTLSFEFDAIDVGSGTGSFVSGSASGTGNVTSPLNFGPFTFAGTATDELMEGTFNFTNPGGGQGVATLQKTSVSTDEQSIGTLKAKAADR